MIGEEPEDDRRDRPDGDPADRAPISLMITRRQRAALRALGHTDEAVAKMTPPEAHALLRKHPESDI